ncbi:hypothetical protein ACJ41O_005998 [Fusarium nematophilum]
MVELHLQYLQVAISASNTTSVSSIETKPDELAVHSAESQKTSAALEGTKSALDQAKEIHEDFGGSVQLRDGAIAGPGIDQVNGVDAESIPCQTLPTFVVLNARKKGTSSQVNGMRLLDFDGSQGLPEFNAVYDSCTAMPENGEDRGKQINGFVFKSSKE